MEEEFRLLTLQVIGEAILGLHHDECDQVQPGRLHCHCCVERCGGTCGCAAVWRAAVTLRQICTV